MTATDDFEADDVRRTGSDRRSVSGVAVAARVTATTRAVRWRRSIEARLSARCKARTQSTRGGATSTAAAARTAAAATASRTSARAASSGSDRCRTVGCAASARSPKAADAPCPLWCCWLDAGTASARSGARDSEGQGGIETR